MSIPTLQGLQTALSGLLAEQQALDVTGHNIANANTEGYSRQSAVLETNQAIAIPALSSITGQGALLEKSPQLAEYSGRVSDSGEGRWTSIAAIEEGVPTPVLTTALHERFYSRDLGDFGDKVLSAMRMQFGGHHEKQDT